MRKSGIIICISMVYIGYLFPQSYCRYVLHSEISPFQVPSVSPNASTTFLNRGPPLSFLSRYRSNFCRLCTNNRKFRLLTLSILPLPSKNVASVRILAVRMAICTSELPVSGPTRGVFSNTFCDFGTIEAGFGSRVESVLCRPKSSMQRCLFKRKRSLLLPNESEAMRRSASAALDEAVWCWATFSSYGASST
jgi:hypothetical protein